MGRKCSTGGLDYSAVVSSTPSSNSAKIHSSELNRQSDCIWAVQGIQEKLKEQQIIFFTPAVCNSAGDGCRPNTRHLCSRTENRRIHSTGVTKQPERFAFKVYLITLDYSFRISGNKVVFLVQLHFYVMLLIREFSWLRFLLWNSKPVFNVMYVYLHDLKPSFENKHKI